MALELPPVFLVYQGCKFKTRQLTLPVLLFTPKPKQVWLFHNPLGLPAVILAYQCCKFKTKQLALRVLCFIPSPRTTFGLSIKTKNHAKRRGFESVVMALGFEPRTACLEEGGLLYLFVSKYMHNIDYQYYIFHKDSY